MSDFDAKSPDIARVLKFVRSRPPEQPPPQKPTAEEAFARFAIDLIDRHLLLIQSHNNTADLARRLLADLRATGRTVTANIDIDGDLARIHSQHEETLSYLAKMRRVIEIHLEQPEDAADEIHRLFPETSE